MALQDARRLMLGSTNPNERNGSAQSELRVRFGGTLQVAPVPRHRLAQFFAAATRASVLGDSNETTMGSFPVASVLGVRRRIGYSL